MFWVEGKDLTVSVIRRAYMNGTRVTDVVTSAVNPSNLAIDIVRKRLFWVSNSGKQIRSVLFDGSEPSLVYSNNMDHPLSGLAVFEDYIYTILPANNSIARVDMFQRKGKVD